MPQRKAPFDLPGPAGPERGLEREPARAVPSLGAFIRGRLISVNGLFAALYLALSIVVYLHPRQAARIWRRLQGL